MPTFIVTSPDGKEWEVDGPEGSTQEQAIEYIKGQWKPQAASAETYDPTEGMSGFDKFAAGMGKSIVDTGRGIGQMFGMADQAEIDEARRLDEALMNTGAGLAGNVAGTIGMMLTPGVALKGASMLPNMGKLATAARAVTAPETIKGAAALGAGMSALQPVATGESRLENAALGAGFGAGGQLAGRAIHAGAVGTKALLEPFTEAGRDRIVGRTLTRFAGNADEAARNMANARIIVQGSEPTVAEVANDAGLAQLQRAAQAADPQIAAALAEREVSQNAARLNALRGVAGDDAEMEAATLARKQAATPLRQAVAQSESEVGVSRVVSLIDRISRGAGGQRDSLRGALGNVREKLFDPYPLEARGRDAWAQLNDIVQNPPRGSGRLAKNVEAVERARTVMDRVKKGLIDGEEALQQLRGLKTTNPKLNEAIDRARKLIKAPDYRHKTNPEQLYGVRQHISDLLNAKGPNGSKINEAIARELTTVMRSLDHQIAKVEPAYAKYLKSYAEKSLPIDRMKVGRELLKSTTSGLEKMGGEPVLYAEQFARTVRDGADLVKKATGFKRNKGLESVFTPDQMATVNSVRDDLARSAMARDFGRSVGSNTAQNLASKNVLRQVLGPMGLPESWAEDTILRNVIRPLDFAYKPFEPAVQTALSNALLNPAKAASLMQPQPMIPGATLGLLGNMARGGSTMLPIGLLNALQE